MSLQGSAIVCLLSLFALLPAWAEERAAVEPGHGVGRFVSKAAAGGSLRVAFLGGSITQNAKGHVQMVPDWLRAKWPQAQFEFINAGLASTCSLAGVFRVAQDVLAQGPVDLLVVEFAVNDDQDAGHDRRTSIRAYEGILRQYFAANPTGDAICVHFVNPKILAKHQQGEEATSVAAHKAVARHYRLPSVDVGLALAQEIAAGRMTWERDYHETHPNETGYRFASQLITSVIDGSAPAAELTPASLPEPLDPACFAEVSRIDPQRLSWLGGWKFAPVSPELLPKGAIRADYTKSRALRSDEAGNYLYHVFSGSTLAAFVLAGPDAGCLEVSIDGGEWREVELYHPYSKGLNYPRAVLLADGLSGQYHSVALRTAEARHPESLGSTATILWFAAAQ